MISRIVSRNAICCLLAMLVFTCPRALADARSDARKAAFEQIHPLFETYVREQHIPGLVYGVVADGKLAHVRTIGVQDVTTRTPVTPDTVFRIASMSKNFTALAVLKLRDEGKLSLDAPAEHYVPELKSLKYPFHDRTAKQTRDRLSLGR
jgi:D-alanyl-D-alanine-carboxypeptidase/D-alanyl-D-alanine-endopeptidase